MGWNCKICGVEHDDVPECFGVEAPWRGFVADDEFEHRVELTDDQCVVDGSTFFIRGQIEIPIHGHPNPLAFSVWSSLSEASFWRMGERWDKPDRDADPPYFGWLCSQIWVYPDTLHLKLSVRSRPPGLTPLFDILDEDHLLEIDQRDGISVMRWHQLALALTA